MSWPTAVVVCVALVVMGVLAALKLDTSNLTWVLLTVIGGVGVGELKAIKDNTNGDKVRMADELAEHRKLIGEMAQTMAGMTPAAAPTDPSSPIP